ncbi:hypothetical protein EV363DRAFT_1298745 [Boletus edulis]|nr:hypothetical protein EV363DRAFT_1298745 [Boletus edulis]
MGRDTAGEVSEDSFSSLSSSTDENPRTPPQAQRRMANTRQNPSAEIQQQFHDHTNTTFPPRARSIHLAKRGPELYLSEPRKSGNSEPPHHSTTTTQNSPLAFFSLPHAAATTCPPALHYTSNSSNSPIVTRGWYRPRAAGHLAATVQARCLHGFHGGGTATEIHHTTRAWESSTRMVRPSTSSRQSFHGSTGGRLHSSVATMTSPQTIACAAKATSPRPRTLIDHVIEGIPRLLKDHLNGDYDSWEVFEDAVRAVSVDRIQSDRRRQEENCTRDQAIETLQQQLTQMSLQTARMPRPATAPAPMYTAAAPAAQRPLEELRYWEELRITQQSNTKDGRDQYEQDIADWHRRNPQFTPNLERPYPLRPRQLHGYHIPMVGRGYGYTGVWVGVCPSDTPACTHTLSVGMGWGYIPMTIWVYTQVEMDMWNVNPA